MMNPRLLTYGNVPVPQTVLWSGEDESFLAVDEWADGLMAMCNPDRQGEGRPMFGKPHMQRHRRAIVLGLCDLCGKPLKGHTKVSLSHAKMTHAARDELVVMQVEPLLHKICAAVSMQHCPSLKKDIGQGSLNVRLVQRYQVQIALLSTAAVLEFTGQTKTTDVAGHAKIVLLSWRDMSPGWLLASSPSNQEQ